jgi:iron complex transport system ATP-binding protein
MNIVDLEAITFQRDQRSILTEVSWSIRQGEHWCVVGANGSGKTTLLNILSGYEWPSSGRVVFMGNLYGSCDLPALRRRIGWVSASLEERLLSHAYLRQTPAKQVVASGLEAALRWYGNWDNSIEDRTRNLLSRLRVDSVADKPFQVLSQGERKKVLIARALIGDPALLILDEPCCGLDPVSRQNFLSDVSRFTRQADGPATLLVTHHVEEIGPWVTHGLGLKAGSVSFSGPLEQVLCSANMKTLYDFPCKLERHSAGYRLLLDGE